MLNSFRQKGLTSAVYGLIIVATVVVFVVQFRPGAQGRSGSLRQECAAEVRGRCIEPKEFQAELMLVAPGRLIEPSQLNRLGLRQIVLDGLVERTLLERDAERLGLNVSDDDLDNELITGRVHVSLPVQKARSFSYPLRLNDGMTRTLSFNNPDTKAFDYKIYDRTVRQFSGRSPTEFKNMQRAEVLAARLRDLVKQRVRVSDAEAFDAYTHEKSTATIRFVKFRPSWFASHALDTSPRAVDAWAKQHDEEIKRVFETRKSEFLPECRRMRQILVKVAPEATDDEKAAAHTKIDALLPRLKHEDFSEVARQVSDDASAAAGGDLGCVSRGKQAKPIEDIAFALGAGEVSGVVQTQFGLHLIKVDAILKDDAAAAEGLRDTTRTLMTKVEGETLAAETAKKVLAGTKAGRKLDEVLAEALAAVERPADKANKADRSGPSEDRPKVEISGAFNAGGDPISGASPSSHVGQLAFQLEHEGDLADDLVKVDDGYAVFQLKEKTLATREQYEKDRDTFLPAMLAAKQADALNGYVARLKDAAKSEIKLNDAYAKVEEKDKRASEGEEE